MNNLPLNREMSTLSFNERVLQEAEDTRNPLMERVKFLGIFSSNMDEFYKVRVASVHRMRELGKKGMTQLLEHIGEKTRELDKRFQAAYRSVFAGLAREGIQMYSDADVLKGREELRDWVRAYFRENVLSHLVPLIVNESEEFHDLADGAVYLGVRMQGEHPRYSILRIPDDLPRFVQLPNGGIIYVDDVIRLGLDDVFYIFDYDRIEAYEFKIQRDAELDMDNDFSEDYVRKMEQELAQRKEGRPTRLVYDAAIPPDFLQLLLRELQIGENDPIIGGGRYHNMKDLIDFPGEREALQFEPMPPLPNPDLEKDRTPVLDILTDRDVMVTHPYQSFGYIIRLLREAAIDPRVEAIKMSLYRAAANSQVVNALVNAARNGKWVFVSIELQARFDEERNIEIAEVLQDAGATVVYGLPPMKVHAKILLIQREGVQYAGLSTGNFNETTGKLYVDSVLLTSHPELTNEVDRVFDYLERASRIRVLKSPRFQHLIVSPFQSRRRFVKLIEGERDKGEDGYILLKVNHLTDERMIRKIREAADAGVKMDLIVRTTYAMRPHPNIRAISLLDRFLEHQRVYIFGKGAARKVYMSSADLMERNLDWRVEAAFPILDPALAAEAADFVEMQIRDDMKARILDETQSNRYVSDGTGIFRSQYETYAYLKRKAERSGTLAEDAEVAPSKMLVR